MMTPNGPPRCGCVTSTTASLKLGSRMSRRATRKMPLAMLSAAAAGSGTASDSASNATHARFIMLGALWSERDGEILPVPFQLSWVIQSAPHTLMSLAGEPTKNG